MKALDEYEKQAMLWGKMSDDELLNDLTKSLKDGLGIDSMKVWGCMKEIKIRLDILREYYAWGGQ